MWVSRSCRSRRQKGTQGLCGLLRNARSSKQSCQQYRCCRFREIAKQSHHASITIDLVLPLPYTSVESGHGPPRVGGPEGTSRGVIQEILWAINSAPNVDAIPPHTPTASLP